ncbi:MAG: hypothetical protein GY789_18595 [Hyphomicrobiales bacterium]|nr:hypothetical protein [Hyphomicrobiales bacterium]MCP5000232.1 hypothetical protein [Hyphomicrobiales bacterium]
MTRNFPQIIIMLTGAVLTTIQFWSELEIARELARAKSESMQLSTRSITTSPSGGFELKTTYVGLVMIVIGATLEVVGYVAATPWRKGKATSQPGSS